MKRLRMILSMSLLLSLCFVFTAYARNEGMLAVNTSDTEQTWMYFTGEGDSYLTNQWKQVWDNWYYFGDDGVSTQNEWVEIDGKWYYFDQWSIMLHETTTPDGYYVGLDGAMVENGVAQTSTIAETQVEAENEPAQTNTYYWTPGGKSYHMSENCTTLKRSKTILSGTLDEAKGAGKNDPCNVCVK